MTNVFKTKVFKIAVIIIAVFMVVYIGINFFPIYFNKYSGFYFRESNGTYHMTKIPLFSYYAENRVINRYNYVLSSTFNKIHILFNITYSTVYPYMTDEVTGSVTFGHKAYPIDDSFFIMKEKDKTINSLYVRSNNRCFYIPMDKDNHILKSAAIRDIDCQSHYEASYSIVHQSSSDDNEIKVVRDYHNVEELKEYVTTLSESKFDIIKEDEIEAASISTGEFMRDWDPDSFYAGLKCSIPIIYDKKSGKYTIMLSGKFEYAENVFEMRRKVYKIMKNAFNSNTCPTSYEIDDHAVVDVFVNDYLISLLMEKIEFSDDYYTPIIVDRNTYKTLDNKLNTLFEENSLAALLFGAYIGFYCNNQDFDIDKIYNQVIDLPDSSLNNFEDNELFAFYLYYFHDQNKRFIIHNDKLEIYPINNKSIFVEKICSIPLDKVTDIVHSKSIYAGKL